MQELNSPTIEIENIENEPFPGSITTNRHPLKILTDNTISVVCLAIKRGNTKKNAFILAGITTLQFQALTRPAKKLQQRLQAQHQQVLQPLEQKLQALSLLVPETPEDQALLQKEEETLYLAIQSEMEQHYQTLQDLAANDVAHRAVQAVALAEASLEDALVDTWYQLRQSDWKAAKDLLARRFPKEWSEAAVQRKAGILPAAGGNQQQVNVNILSQQNQLSQHSQQNGAGAGAGAGAAFFSFFTFGSFFTSAFGGEGLERVGEIPHCVCHVFSAHSPPTQCDSFGTAPPISPCQLPLPFTQPFSFFSEQEVQRWFEVASLSHCDSSRIWHLNPPDGRPFSLPRNPAGPESRAWQRLSPSTSTSRPGMAGRALMSTGAEGAAAEGTFAAFFEATGKISAAIADFSSGVASFIMAMREAADSTGVLAALLGAAIAEAEAIANCGCGSWVWMSGRQPRHLGWRPTSCQFFSSFDGCRPGGGI